MDEFDKLREIKQDRSQAYGPAYIRQGDIMSAMFPEGLELKTQEEHVRYGLLGMIVSKLTRFANAFAEGHQDSLRDMAIYCTMLEERYGEDIDDLSNGVDHEPTEVEDADFSEAAFPVDLDEPFGLEKVSA